MPLETLTLGKPDLSGRAQSEFRMFESQNKLVYILRTYQKPTKLLKNARFSKGFFESPRIIINQLGFVIM